jgi:hypothetical protein
VSTAIRALRISLQNCDYLAVQIISLEPELPVHLDAKEETRCIASFTEFDPVGSDRSSAGCAAALQGKSAGRF